MRDEAANAERAWWMSVNAGDAGSTIHGFRAGAAWALSMERERHMAVLSAALDGGDLERPAHTDECVRLTAAIDELRAVAP